MTQLKGSFRPQAGFIPTERASDAFADLRALAEAATHQSWAAFTDDSGPRPHTNLVSVSPRTDCALALPGAHKRDPNVAFIGAATPARILSLLDGHAALLEALTDCLSWHDYADDLHKPLEVRAAYMRARSAIQSATGEG